jgi:hypothetical protein
LWLLLVSAYALWIHVWASCHFYQAIWEWGLYDVLGSTDMKDTIG